MPRLIVFSPIAIVGLGAATELLAYRGLAQMTTATVTCKNVPFVQINSSCVRSTGVRHFLCHVFETCPDSSSVIYLSRRLFLPRLIALCGD